MLVRTVLAWLDEDASKRSAGIVHKKFCPYQTGRGRGRPLRACPTAVQILEPRGSRLCRRRQYNSEDFYGHRWDFTGAPS